MKNTTQYLMESLGWQGGTVHQVASVTGLKVQEILNLEAVKIEDVYQLETYNSGLLWAIEGGKEITVPKVFKGKIFFWLGVLQATKQNPTSLLKTH